MTRELDELASCAANDASIADPALSRAIAEAIETTRRHWTALSEERLPLDAKIAVGIGVAALTCDGEIRYEHDGGRRRDAMTVSEAEKLAAREPGRVWRIHLVAQLDDRHYRRRAPGQWVLYERGYGMS